MSFTQMKDNIDYNDTVFIHIGFDNMVPIIVKKGESTQTKFGHIKHDQIVGKAFGSKYMNNKGWVHLIHPTPELWTLGLPHRTQILYTTDISMVILQLDIQPGSVVVEAGTGSGSLSHSFLRTVQPSGRLLTFEFHEERSKKARLEFEEHGLQEFVTCTHRDVCADGFQLSHVADAVFLDLPRPWECITSSKAAIKKEGGRICSFSPCIEQVQRTCEELARQGFSEISTLECLQRNYNVQYAKLQNMNLGDKKIDTPAQKSDSSIEEVDLKADSHKSTDPPAKSVKLEVSNDKSNEDISESCKESSNVSQFCFTSAVPVYNMPGHTGFLTFASLWSH